MANIEKRTAKDGTLSYRVKVRIQGQPTQSKSFPSLRPARAWAVATEAALRSGKTLAPCPTPSPTLSELLTHHAMAWQGKEDRAYIYRFWVKRLGARRLADITPADIASARDELLTSGKAAATAGKFLVVLGCAYRLAIDELGWCDSNPCARVKKPRVDNARCRYLVRAE